MASSSSIELGHKMSYNMSTLDKLSPLQTLIVEDDHINQLILSNFMQDMGHQVDIAGTARDALRQILERPQVYDLILLDIGLPDYSGIVLTTKLRHLCHVQKSQIPIIAVTGHG